MAKTEISCPMCSGKKFSNIQIVEAGKKAGLEFFAEHVKEERFGSDWNRYEYLDTKSCDSCGFVIIHKPKFKSHNK